MLPVTDAFGNYHVRFTTPSFRQRGKKHPDWQAQVYEGETFIAGSDVRYNATNNEILDVKLPTQTSTLRSRARDFDQYTGLTL